MQGKARVRSVWTFLLLLTVLSVLWRDGDGHFRQSLGIPTLEPTGIDFRAVYHWASALRRGGGAYFSAEYTNNVYPPAATLLFLPMTLLPEDTAYHLYAAALWVFLFATIALSSSLPARFKWAEHGWTTVSCFAVLASSYPVLFAVERGNSDITAALLMVVCLGSMLTGRSALAFVALTAATQLKLYPAILVALLALRRGVGTAVLFLVINGALLFVLGRRAFGFFRNNLAGFSTAGYCWGGNHSLYCLLQAHGIESVRPYAAALLLGFAVAAGAVYLRSGRGRSLPADRLSTAEISLAGMGFALMSLVPNVSHDYKLPIQVVPFLLLTGSTALDGGAPGSARRIALPVIAVAEALLFPPRAGLRTPFLLALYAAYALLLVGELWRRGDPAAAVGVDA
jgi:glycosyl transferase family 87